MTGRQKKDETMKKTVKRQLLLAVFLAGTMLLLSGCVSQIDERPLEDLRAVAIEIDAPAPMQDACTARTERAMLYFLAGDGLALRPVAREIVVEAGMSRAEAALRALLAGPNAEETDVFWPEIGALGDRRLYECSGGVATVDLPARVRALTTQELYAIRMAITHTLTEFSEIDYVNVLVGGREEGFDLAATVALGALTRTEELDLSTAYTRLNDLRQESEQNGFSRMTTIYVPSANGRYILPEVRNVSYSKTAPIEYLYTLLSELGSAPVQPETIGLPAPMKYIQEMPEIVRTQDDAYRAIELRFSASLDDALCDAGLTRGAYLAAITETLMSFVPGVDGVVFYINGVQLMGVDADATPDGEEVVFEQGIATRSAFSSYIGAQGVVYLPVEEGGLWAFSCVYPQDKQDDVRTRLTMVIGMLTESGFLPETISGEDVIAVSVEETRALVHVSRRMRDALAALTPQREREVMYALVNTITQGNDLRRVAFYFDGEQVSTLAGGLEMRGELMRNPGMVVSP